MAILRVAGVVKQSIVDGAGLRFTVFTQGCPHRCPGCHNPETHDFSGGYDCGTDTILAEFDRNPLLRGITLSGGEPFAQAEGLAVLAREIRWRGKDVWCYTGYTLEQLLEQREGHPEIRALLELVDVLVDGPYLEGQRDLTLRFRGSRNQRLLDLPPSLEEGQPVELRQNIPD